MHRTSHLKYVVYLFAAADYYPSVHDEMMDRQDSLCGENRRETLGNYGGAMVGTHLEYIIDNCDHQPNPAPNHDRQVPTPLMSSSSADATVLHTSIRQMELMYLR